MNPILGNVVFLCGVHLPFRRSLCQGKASLARHAAEKASQSIRGSANQRPISRIIGWAALSAVVPGGPAIAQERPFDELEFIGLSPAPQGLEIGSFTLFPAGEADVRYDSNVYNRESSRVADAVAVGRPTVRVVSDWRRHAVDLGAGAEVRRHFDLVDENSEQFAIRAALRFDLPDRMALSPSLLVARRIERRGTVGDAFQTDEPVSYSERTAALQFTRDRGLIGLTGTGEQTEYTYRDATIDGVPLDQSFRDVRRRNLELRGDYGRGHRLSVYGVGRLNAIDYARNVGATRDSTGFSVLAGARYFATDLLEIEAAAGYIAQNFEDPAEADFSGLDFDLRARWTPSPRALVTVEAGRSVERSPIPSVSAIVQSRIAASAKYAVGDRLIAGLELAHTADDYGGGSRQEQNFTAEVTAEYLVTTKLKAFAGGGFRVRNGSGMVTREYDGVSVRVGMRFTS